MEAAFKDLQKEGKNDVDNLLKWMKDSKVVAETKEAEDKARSYFNIASDKKNVSVDQFKDVLKKVSDDANKNFDGVMKQLGDLGPKLLQDLKASGTAAAASISSAVSQAVKDFVPK